MNTSQPRPGGFENQRGDDKNRRVLENFDFTDMQDIVRQTTAIDKLRLGDILDAQDYLGSWYLAIVIDDISPSSKQIHFLPYQRSNRDETFSADD